MIKAIDGYYVAAQIRMLRQVHKGTVLILEGETDARIFDRFIDLNACRIEIGCGKSNVLEALDLLEDEGFPGAGLRLAFDWEAMTDTTVYGCIRAWETTNKPYRVFRL
jgi:hypothetical protein